MVYFVEVDDPYEHGAKILAARSRRDDPLANLHARRHIDDAQYEAGRKFQHDFEIAEEGPQAIDPSKEKVDGGRMREPLSEARSWAVVRLNNAHVVLGQDGSALVHDVLISGYAISQLTLRRGYSGERWEKYFGMRFRECLDCLAKLYGFAG